MARPNDLKPRKIPRQARARETEAVILQAAARVLVEAGPLRFNTNRVAERAGVSVGSLYQYYPNKAALLLRLHELESGDTMAAVAAILLSGDGSPRERLHAAVREFFRTEAAEAPLRRALALVEVEFHESESFPRVEAAAVAVLESFLRDSGLEVEAGLAGFAITLVSATAERLTSRRTGDEELMRMADELSAMLCARLGL